MTTPSNTHSLNRMAMSATLHCLTGCAIGEVAGLIIGTAFGLGTVITLLLAVTLAFLFGFGLSTLPLLRSGIALSAAIPLVLAADTLSIATMEVVDNFVMGIVPGAMDSGITHPLFWITMAFSLVAAFFAAYPVNKYLLKKNKGHALVMKYHNNHTNHHKS